MQTSEIRRRKSEVGLLALALVFMTAIGGIGWFNFNRQQTAARKDIEKELTTIADLKASRIAGWMQERRGDAEVALNNVQARLFLAGTNNAGARGEMFQWMTAIQRASDYEAVGLFDSHGALLLASPADASLQNTNIVEQIQTGLRAREVIVADFYRDRPDLPAHLDLLVPVGVKQQTNGLADGVLLFEIDPSRFLFPLVQSWPTSSRSAETVLVRREGNDVVRLNGHAV